MAKWRPRISTAVEDELRALGPYSIERSGWLAWPVAPGFDWPWGEATLSFSVDYRDAGDADFRRLLDAWRQVRARRDEVVERLRGAIVQGWEWARGNRRDDDRGGPEEGAEDPFRQVQGCGLVLGTLGPGQVNIIAYVAVDWDEEHGVEVDLIDPDRRPSWSFL